MNYRLLVISIVFALGCTRSTFGEIDPNSPKFYITEINNESSKALLLVIDGKFKLKIPARKTIRKNIDITSTQTEQQGAITITKQPGSVMLATSDGRQKYFLTFNRIKDAINPNDPIVSTSVELFSVEPANIAYKAREYARYNTPGIRMNIAYSFILLMMLRV